MAQSTATVKADAIYELEAIKAELTSMTRPGLRSPGLLHQINPAAHKTLASFVVDAGLAPNDPPPTPCYL